MRERKRKGQKEDKISIEVRDEEKLVLIFSCRGYTYRYLRTLIETPNKTHNIHAHKATREISLTE